MIEVIPRLYVGSQHDYETLVKGMKDWSVLQACKVPYHRDAVGGTISKDHPEYLIAKRGQCLILNMIDAPDPKFFSDKMVEAGLRFIKDELASGKNVLVHCNQGMSRSPSMALLHLRRTGHPQFSKLSFEQAEDAFSKIYPDYSPALGIRGYLQQNWD